jgi:3-oxoacyl-[acyl-carrier protein] reductase
MSRSTASATSWLLDSTKPPHSGGFTSDVPLAFQMCAICLRRRVPSASIGTMRKQSLKGKIAIVTGAGRGIGRSIALALSRVGVTVALTARTEKQLLAVQSEIKKSGGRAVSCPADLVDEAAIANVVKSTVKRFGHLDIVVNNAGMGIFGPLAETTTKEWDEVMAVNARGPFLLCRAAIPYLRRSKRPFIISIGSVVSVKGYIDQAAYTASKHALLGMSKSLAKEVQKDSIRVHAICPGGVDTELVTKARPDLNRAELIHPDEIAEIVIFLLTRCGNAVIDQIDVHRASGTPWA